MRICCDALPSFCSTRIASRASRLHLANENNPIFPPPPLSWPNLAVSANATRIQKIQFAYKLPSCKLNELSVREVVYFVPPTHIFLEVQFLGLLQFPSRESLSLCQTLFIEGEFINYLLHYCPMITISACHPLSHKETLMLVDMLAEAMAEVKS